MLTGIEEAPDFRIILNRPSLVLPPGETVHLRHYRGMIFLQGEGWIISQDVRFADAAIKSASHRWCFGIASKTVGDAITDMYLIHKSGRI